MAASIQPRREREADRHRARGKRVDAQRNEEAILRAAKNVFRSHGVDAPAREIASKACVGIGTLYRRFPKRSDLIAAVFRREVDACLAEAEKLASTLPPADAVAAWLNCYAGFIATKQGLGAALHSGDPAYDDLPAYFRANFEPALQSLLEAASSIGAMRGDIVAFDLLRAIGNLSVATGQGASEHIQRMVDLLIDGLRSQIKSTGSH